MFPYFSLEEAMDTLGVFYTFHEDLNLETANHLTFPGHTKGKK
jgi:hypothetical protein